MSSARERFDDVGKKIKRDSDASISYNINYSQIISTNNNSNMGVKRSNNMVGGPSHVGGGGVLNTVTPCAACKLLRRRCAEECPFSPYFSPHEPQKFAAVHKVFGASNVSKMLMEVPQNQRADAANSLVYEANLRLRDPVYGCMGAISALQQQIQALQAELNIVRAEILKYKYREATSTTNNNNNPINTISSTILNNNVTLLPNTVGGHVPNMDTTPPPPPQPPAPPLPPRTPPPPPPSIVVASSSNSSSNSSLYTTPSSTTVFNSISTNDHNVPFFD